MNTLGKSAGFGAAVAAGATAHMASAAKYLQQHISPVIARDLYEIEQHGRLPHVQNPLPQPGQYEHRGVGRMWLGGALRGALFGVIGCALLMGALGGMMGQEGIPRPAVALMSGFLGGMVGVPIGAALGWAFAAFVTVPRTQQSRLREDQRETMARYWDMREHLREELDEGTLTPEEAVAHIEPWRFPDAQ